jgi:mercuric ion transport protein
MRFKQGHPAAESRLAGLVAAGGILAALASASCCIAPLVLFSLGVSGAWIGQLTALAPYQPYFIAATLAFLAAGTWLVYRASKVICPAGEACARPPSTRLVKLALLVSTLLVAAALGLDLLAPIFLNS